MTTNRFHAAINNEDAFYRNLKVFLNETEGRKFASHIKWNEAGDKIEVGCNVYLRVNV
jgi:hypothetical protein